VTPPAPSRSSGAVPGVDPGAGPPPGPGGAALLARAVALAGLAPGARVLDVGCGTGRSVELLRRRFGLAAVGVDQAAGAAYLAGPGTGGSPQVRARGERLPVADGAVDAVLLECVLSVAADREGLLAECARVLAPGGRLLLADLYARDGADPGPRGPGCGATFLPREALAGLVARQGLEVASCEDRSEVLREYLFRQVMERGPAEELWSYLGGAGADPDEVAASVRRLRPGYLLLLAVKVR
jgi:arsenite methyltransferase